MDRRLVLAALIVTVIAVAAAPRASAVCEPVFSGPTTIGDLGATTRAWGIAAGDFDRDGNVDVVAGRALGQLFFLRGNGDGTFAAATQYAWKQAAFNAWAFSAADVNGDGNLDVVWGSSADSPPTAPVVVSNGDVRVFYGNGDGTFVENAYTISGVLHNAGTLLADIGSRAATVAAGDIDGDGDGDAVVGGIDGTDTVVKILRNDGGSFSIEELIRMPIGIATPASPIYFPAPGAAATNQTLDRPWGLALGDAEADGDLDLWVGDRAFYVYLYRNDGAGVFTLQGGNTSVTGRPNVYLGHDAFRPAVGYTLSIAARDVNGDARADLVLGLLNEKSGGTLSGLAHDGEIILDTSRAAGGHGAFGLITGAVPASDAGSSARGVAIADVNNDGLNDAIVGTWEGPIKLYLSQAPSTAACDDGDPCTLDTCSGGACSNALVADDTPCSDGLFCTEDDICQGGTCLSGPARECSDSVDCTLDACSEAAGCEHTPANGACNDGNFCTEDSCDVATGCASTPKADGTPCDDANACTLGDACVEGVCLSGADLPSCDDGNPCTSDVCDPSSGCAHNPVGDGTSCDDGDFCTPTDRCAAGSCLGSGAINCDDGNQCTQDGCAPSTGCVHTPDPDGAYCSDGNACTTAEACLFGLCVGGVSVSCNDDNPCTDDSCDAQRGCVYTPNDAPCDDGNACTLGDACLADSCRPGAGTPDCDDFNPCTDDACVPSIGCVNTPNNAPCDDGNACTLGDACLADSCRPGAGTPDCDDFNPCTDDACVPSIGCVNTPNDVPCDDANACTLGDTCGDGSCRPGAGAPQCDDGNVCTADGCDPTAGCESAPLTGIVCDDGSLCTTGDTCQLGVCTGLSHANEPTPRTSGYYRRLCKGPHSGDQLTQTDVACVSDVPNFATVATLDDLCYLLEGQRDGAHDGAHDGECRQAETELMTFALNRCRARACDESSLLSHCGDGANATVAASFTEAGALAFDVAARTGEMCRVSACLSREVNNGHAFVLDKVRGDGTGGGGIALSWDEPYLDDGAGHPTGYEIYRRPIDDTSAAFTKIGETADRAFTDDTPGDFQYEIVTIAGGHAR